MQDGGALSDQVREIISTALALDESEVTNSINQNNCARWTSLSHMLLMVAIEEHFGVELAMHEMLAMVSLERIVDVLRSHNVDAVIA
ncbi:MAG: acyl carrier protein [Chloroflexota bacterium]|nr:acyl carrier protein [Chloroflexota bacterium]